MALDPVSRTAVHSAVAGLCTGYDAGTDGPLEAYLRAGLAAVLPDLSADAVEVEASYLAGTVDVAAVSEAARDGIASTWPEAKEFPDAVRMGMAYPRWDGLNYDAKRVKP